MSTVPLTQRPAWKALQDHHAEIGERHLRDLFADDPGRGERLAVEGAGLYLDYSKHRITDETVALLMRLATNRGCASASTPCSAAITSTCRKTARCCTSRCACHARRR